jgi:hypothetical protein
MSMFTIIAALLAPARPIWTSDRPFAPRMESTVPATASPVETTTPAEPEGFVSGRSGLDLRFGDQLVPYQRMGVFCLPGETVPVTLQHPDPALQIAAESGSLAAVAPGRWTWTAPSEPGHSVVRVLRDGAPVVTLNAFVMVPYGEMTAGTLRGYRIGAYPRPRPGHEDRDARPRGFVAINGETADLAVSPHFRLAQFACKAGEGLPKFAVVQPRLLLRLEGLLEEANHAGLRAGTFELMSAYRTPLYNRSIGNTTSFTRHQYGDAADIFIDEHPRDGRMDDLNRDGRFDRADAMVLHRLADATEDSTAQGGVAGGLSAYAPNHAHGAFVHVDTRGHAARW